MNKNIRIEYRAFNDGIIMFIFDGEQLKEYREYSKWEMTFIPDIIRQDFGVFED